VCSLVVIALIAVVNWRSVPFAVVVGLGASQTYSWLNNVLRFPRPSAGLVRVTEHAGGYGWPSGHASFAVVQVTLLVWCVAAVYLPRRLHTALTAPRRTR
jgi:membrane-associated phospholipid phosphatase